MKKLFILFFISILSINLYSQSAYITSKLYEKLESAETTTFFKVNVLMKEQVDHRLLKEGFKQNNVPLGERAKTVLRQSQSLAKSEQQLVIDFLKSRSEEVKSITQYWIANMLTIDATKDIIVELSTWPEISYIEDYDHFQIQPIGSAKVKGPTNKAIGGIEPGLAAINAPALWALGYTGRGTKFYSIDSGVWPNHPALSERFLGNFLPLNQTWLNWDPYSAIPVDRDNSHGTHTSGTVLGLEQSTNDTIGVAFNAHFIASDAIGIFNLPFPEIMSSFQFALNPDGDTSTTHDIPDAINNSWGYQLHNYNSYAEICATSTATLQILDAIETAGIASVFAAGNEGPSDSTMRNPQFIGSSLVNTFAVGAVDGHNTSYPIANFSSRGPTYCPVPSGPNQSSREIKPEVVAPGVNIRSATGSNGYGLKDGTSMATPHVTGAVLLLKEAFPNVSGEEILLALYNSASDLGVAGEDNNYGKGMIDVLAAFNELSLSYTPSPPVSISPYNITVSEIEPIDYFNCDQSFSPKIVIKNIGDSTIFNSLITYRLNNEPSSVFNWLGTLTPGDTASITLPSITAQGSGEYALIVKAEIDPGSSAIENDTINNQRIQNFNIRPTYANLPYFEDFENKGLTLMDTSDWLVTNPDTEVTWDTTITGGLPNGQQSAVMPMFGYDNIFQSDALYSPKITLPNQDSLFLKFDLSYQMLPSATQDKLTIFISTNCGASYTQLYSRSGTTLQTTDTVTNNFIPSYPGHWRTENVDLTSYANNDIILKFEASIQFLGGNNLYLDNIWVYQGEEPTAIIEKQSISKISIYPNPTKNNFVMDIGDNSLKNAHITIQDLSGRNILVKSLKTKQTQIDLSLYRDGIYFINFTNTNGSIVHKIVKN